MRVVVDTNVAIVANGGFVDASMQCVDACIDALLAARTGGVVVDDALGRHLVDHLRHVLQQEGDTFPRSDGAGPEEGGEPAATIVQTCVRQRFPRVGDDGGLLPSQPRLKEKDVGDRAKRHHIVHPPST